MSFHVPENFRITDPRVARARGAVATKPGEGQYGAFCIPASIRRQYSLWCIASDGSDWQEMGLPGVPWEHVSISTPVRCPLWDEMAFVKSLFWDAEDCVVQFHPPESDYINCHPFVLHLWRPVGVELPRPPLHHGRPECRVSPWLT